MLYNIILSASFITHLDIDTLPTKRLLKFTVKIKYYIVKQPLQDFLNEYIVVMYLAK